MGETGGHYKEICCVTSACQATFVSKNKQLVYTCRRMIVYISILDEREEPYLGRAHTFSSIGGAIKKSPSPGTDDREKRLQ